MIAWLPPSVSFESHHVDRLLCDACLWCLITDLLIVSLIPSMTFIILLKKKLLFPLLSVEKSLQELKWCFRA